MNSYQPLDPPSTIEERVRAVMHVLWYGVRDPIAEGFSPEMDMYDVFELHQDMVRKALNNEPDARRDRAIRIDRELAAMPKGLTFSEGLEYMNGGPIEMPTADALRKVFPFPAVSESAPKYTYPGEEGVMEK